MWMLKSVTFVPNLHLIYFLLFVRQACYVAHAGLELAILMRWLSYRYNAIIFSCFQIFGAKHTPVYLLNYSEHEKMKL